MTNAIVMCWDYPRVGREKQAAELFQAVTSYLGQQEKNGGIDSFEPVLVAPNGGDLGGFFLIRGEVSDLDELRHSDEFLKLTMQCGNVLDGFGVCPSYSGDAVDTMMKRWNKIIS